jgi:hypothetical protein
VQIIFRNNKKKIIITLVGIIILLCLTHLKKNKNDCISPYPFGKNFAFTITDDPDNSNLEDQRVVYDFLYNAGLKTTIAVWVSESIRSTGLPDKERKLEYGDTCERHEYKKYMQQMQKRGFEIALHTATPGNDTRDKTIEGYDKFKDIFGQYPQMNIMHASNLENIYWGEKVSNNYFAQKVIRFFSEKARFPYGGEDIGSKYFWGDICKEKTKYVRLWGSADINTLKFNPSMPYFDSKKPYVNYWFSFSHGDFIDNFNKLIQKENVDRLRVERGACIVYTHFSHEFVKNGNLNDEFQKKIDYIASHDDGWFVPASVILDRLLLIKNIHSHTVKDHIVVNNYNDEMVEGLTLLLKPTTVYKFKNKIMETNHEGELIIDKLEGKQNIVIEKLKKKQMNLKNEKPGFFEEWNMFINRSMLYIYDRIG